MENTADRAIAIVAAGAVLPDAPNVPAFWENVKNGRYSISEVAPDRWDPARYYDSDHNAPDKTYSKIGGWVREHVWDPMKWHIAIPPRVVDSLDDGQKWAISCTREALEDYGYPKRTLDLERTAVILGNSMAGERHYLTSLRIHFPEYAHELEESASFAALPAAVRRDIIREFHVRIGQRLPEITEDTMPGELSSCLAGRIANVFNFRGPNFVVDAACASTMAAVTSAMEGLIENDFDVAIAGGIDRNMGAPTFIKFCKIGALSATGIRPFAEGADGFVMGEGAVLLMLKRLADAERDGDNIYAVLRGIGGASDGKGKGITAPNPVGQRLSIERAWHNAGLSPATATLIEGHGTSTPVGDVVEAQSLNEVLSSYQLPRGSVALGSVKSNIGHLKSAAGAVGLLKTALALRDKVLPPSVHCEHPNPDIDFDHSPLRVNTELRPWTVAADSIRRAGVSAFGFGGTNFHAVLEEYIPHRLNGNGKRSIAVGVTQPAAVHKAPLRGALVIGAPSDSALSERLRSVQKAAESGRAPAPSAPAESDLRAPERLAIDYADAAELADKSAKALKGLVANQPAVWKALRAQGIFRGHGPAPKVAFLYTGQGSQYVNMLKSLRALEPIVAQTFAEADRVMTPLLGKPLSDFIFVDQADANAVTKAEEDLRQTAITQPAVLAADIALTRLLAAYGIQPDMTMGHSLGEYGALIASGGLPFADALEAVSARGREMTRVSVEDNGKMAAVIAPLDEIERILKTIDGYVVIANINSDHQAVIGGATKTVEHAMEVLQKAGYEVVPLPVSHAFHTSIVAPASEPLRQVLQRLRLQSPSVPIVANVNGEFYPTGPDAAPQMVDILGRQIASPVQFVKGLRKLYESGARVFVEVGPKKALQGFVDDVLGGREDVVSLFTNHPKVGDVAAFNQALCGLYATGLGAGQASDLNPKVFEEFAKWGGPPGPRPTPTSVSVSPVMAEPDQGVRRGRGRPPHSEPVQPGSDRYLELGHLLADVLDRASQIYHGQNGASTSRPVTITGAALGLPGTEHIFDDSNVSRILRGEQFIDVIPARFRRAILDKHITRLVKSDNGGPTFETIDAVGDVIKLAGRAGAFDLEKEFGVSADRMPALDRVTQLAIAAGLDALRDAGIPLVMRYKTTSKGTQLPDRWGLPDSLRDDTGVIFASAFPGYDSFAEEASRYYQDRARREQLDVLQNLRARLTETNGHSAIAQEIDNRIDELRTNGKEPYVLDRRFLFKILAMGHSQFAEFIGARGPNAHVNAACASTTQAVAVAEDWIRAGRCRRVIVVAADDITSDHLLEWMGAGFLASGAAATDEVVEDAALPFDRRRHGMIIGMGAAALVVEDADAARERGILPICEVLSAVTANSAFHGTRLDVQHICQVMEKLVAEAEARSGIPRRELARQMVFVSHETYTPARGGSAAAEIHALRQVFGEDADRIVIANTKGFTGHAMGAGIEDVVAVKALETGCVPPVANFKEVDPELGTLNLSKGAVYPIEYALRLGAGFGSQISMTLLRRVATKDGLRPSPNALGYSYRIADPTAWNAWLSQLAGGRAADLEIVHRTLRVRDAEAPVRVAEVAQDLEPATTSCDPVKERVLALVVEKTGYPLDMLALDLDLEADLGIDTVKQAEMFAAIREIYNIPRDENLKLRDFPTLAHVIRFASGKRPDLAAPTVAAPTPALADNSIEERVLAIVTEKTGYPKDMLDLDLDLEADLGIDTVKQAEMFAAIRELYNIPRDENLKLRDFPTLAHVIRFASGKRPDLATPVPCPPQSVSGDSIEEKVLAIVTEKTGYPKDMLDLDLDLEADLGIDTVKQAEMFAAIREIYNIPRDENLKLRDFPTLAHVIRFAQDRRTSSTVEPKQSAPPAQPILASLEATNSIPRRVPVPTLRPPLSMCKSTGVTLGPGSRVIVMADKGGVAEALTDQLRTLGVEVLRIDDAPQADVLDAGPVQGVYWLPALDNEGNLSDMDLATWREAVRVRVKSLYATMRTLYEQIYQPGTFLISATMLGGQHGYDDAGAVAPLGGAVTGFTKTYKRERLDALVKAVDFAPECAAPEIAEILIQETQLDPGALEIGYKGGLRFAVGLEEQPAANGQPGLELNKDSVFLITGAAGSIVSAITADLAAASGGTFYLLDLAPEPKPDDPDLERFMSDKDGLKRDLFARMQSSGERATPARIEKELAALERAQAARSAIDAVRVAGGTAYYFSVNLTDADAVDQVISEVRERSGRIDVLLHAAGMERSHLLRDKDPREFDLVFDVKSDGWFNLLHAIGDMPLGVTVAFSSVAARFGNAGQADYSSANDLLCKITSSFRTTRPATRGIVVDWTAWAGIGMASRGSIPKMMELAGIDMLPPEAGIPLIRRELTAGDTRGEIVIGRRLGILLNEWDATGGLDTTAAEAQGPMIGKLAGMGLHSGLSIETTLDPAVQPFLHDHQIDGTPVLPGVMAVEAFAEAALSILPGWYVESVEDVNFQSPLKFYRQEPRTVITEVVFHPQGDTVEADCRLTGRRILPNHAEPQITTHFTGRVRLTKRRPVALTAPAPQLPAGSIKDAANIYRVYFHGPSYRVMERAWADENRMVGQMAANLPADIEPRQPIIMAPRLIELCFQTVGLWELDVRGRAGLPERIRQVSVCRAPELAEGPLYAVVTPDHESFDADVVDTAGNVYVHLSGYRTVALFNGVDAEPAKELHAVEV
jgi:acyl transferase domain-containing protein/NAD(P)-dependent dehydrogenase (short-subunit alcohol dehydrogenase family)/acyl carrier protein